jgi:excisionase family DNA binding protein
MLNTPSKGGNVQQKPQEGVPGYVSVGYIARRCGVSNTTVLRWITSGEIQAFRLPGGHYRVDIREFTAFREKYNIPDDTSAPADQENGKTRRTKRTKK